jgi:hypothetical protein
VSVTPTAGTHAAMVHQIKKARHDNLGYGLRLEGVAALE